MSRRPLSRRTVLGGLASLGLVGSVGGTERIRNLATRQRVQAPDLAGVDRSAAGFTEQALWRGSGMATEVSFQVMYPGDTALTLEAFTAQDALDRVDVGTAAANAARLQDAYFGGFDSFADDFLGPWTRSTYGAVLLSNRTGIDIDRDAAAGFLTTMQKQSGGFAERYDFFKRYPMVERLSSTDHALWALQGLGALTEDVRTSAVSFLQNKQTPQGGWPWLGDVVEPSTLGTYHALRALDAVDAATKRNHEEAAAYLRSLQADGGGFYAGDSPTACNPGNNDEPLGGIILRHSGTDRERDADPWTCSTQDRRVTTYSTARAILGLARADALDTVEDLQQHADWLAARQFTDPADPRFTGGFDAKEGGAVFLFPRSTTRLALRAFAALAAHGVTPSTTVDIEAAIEFLVACQHPGTGGFGAWPSYVQSLPSTAAAMRSLDALDADPPADNLATTLAATQAMAADSPEMETGAIPPEGWKYETLTSQTASALLALATVDRLDAVDVDGAASVIAGRQTPKAGGFGERSGDRPTIQTSGVAAQALGTVDAGDRIDGKRLVLYFGAQQDEDDGAISALPYPYTRTADTSNAIRGLAALGLAEKARYLDDAVDYLASIPAEDGEYWPSPAQAGQAVLGLAAVDALDRIDTAATRAYLEENQYDTGGYTARGFFLEYASHTRHAAAVDALDRLGGTPPDTGSTSLTGGGAPGPGEISTVAPLAPGRGRLNHRAIRVDPAALSDGDTQ